ncbi:ribosome hibernation-promoting factor, HPF/YfiA family [Neptuniibacter caesariensis]|uniref:Sigma 54 modulation protein/ribosomal protein S30EA n=1 Tax=Neptuniibacter caesariensis TaxID=207954 RepID=A0A7U8C421_NEPCE|nr:ribosome-associated translation inhibitor RaiA [Neptuniibacter caesariensis]EAR59524.1 sigma 54 modulation protein/ribosomal protein S30EA [Oceanospirillum sp. MED92] [Neptuniibacter caesariensis]
MNVKITHRNVKASDSIKEKVEGWLDSSQERYEVITSAHVILEKNDREDIAEATVHVAGKDIFAKASADNLYAALDSLADKIDRQLDKIHQKNVNKKGVQRPATEAEIEAEPA